MVIDIKPKQHHKYTEKDDEIIRIYYDHTHKSMEIIAGILNLSYYSIKGRVDRLGLLPSRKLWSKDDDEGLIVLAEQYAVSTIAKMINRSQSSIMHRLHILRVSTKNRYGWYTQNDLLKCLGVYSPTVQGWINKGKLKASYHTDVKPSKQSGAMWHIDEKDLIAFMRKYPQELIGRKIDMIWLVDLLVGVTK